jgi:prevent-host-death family protein
MVASGQVDFRPSALGCRVRRRFALAIVAVRLHRDTMRAKRSVSIKELHARTGGIVRESGQSPYPVQVTDRGVPVAVLGPPELVGKPARRQRRLLPEYAALLHGECVGSVLDDLDAVRGNR